MNVRRVLIASMLAAVAVGPLAAQGIPSGARISRTPTAATRIMVATPFVFASADSATAVAVGQAIHTRMVRVAIMFSHATRSSPSSTSPPTSASTRCSQYL